MESCNTVSKNNAEALSKARTMPILEKIISAGPSRKSRLHDEKDNFIGLERLLLHAPQAVLTGLLRLSIGYRPELPWISYSAIAVLESFLTKTSRVLEFGSGMSTIWYARHAGEVWSVEDCRPWFDKVVNLIGREGIKSVNLRFASGLNEYSQFMPRDTGFDLIMVDGNYRSACVAHAIGLLKPGGIFYLDNSDRGIKTKDDETRLAEEAILRFARERRAEVIHFTDFAPAQFFVQEGLMIKLPDPTAQ